MSYAIKYLLIFPILSFQSLQLLEYLEVYTRLAEPSVYEKEYKIGGNAKQVSSFKVTRLMDSIYTLENLKRG